MSITKARLAKHLAKAAATSYRNDTASIVMALAAFGGIVISYGGSSKAVAVTMAEIGVAKYGVA